MALLAYFSVTIVERMHSQRMTVFDLPMSLVYGRRRPRLLHDAGAPDPGGLEQRARRLAQAARRHRSNSRRLKAGLTDADPDFRFLCDPAGRHSGVHRAGGLVAALHPLHRRNSRFRDPAPDGGRARQLSAAGGAVLHSRRQSDELRRHHQPHLRFRGGDLRLDEGRSRARQHLRLGDLRRHVRHRDRRCRRPRHHRDQGDEGPRLQHRIRGRRHRGLRHARSDHPAVAAVRDLRHDGQRLDRRAVSRRLHPRRRHDARS